MKLEPVTVTVVPTGPLVGDKPIDEATTLKFTEGEFVPSEAMTALLPGVLEGTTKLQEKDPEASEVTVLGEVDTVTLLNLTVIVEEALNPEPETVTEMPEGPVVGFREMAEVIVNPVVGELVPSVAVIV
jgi:hypothetical protein